MRIVVAVNPGAGRGRGEAIGERVARALAAEGHEVLAMSAQAAAAEGAPGTDLLVAVGGDGTVHALLPRLVGPGAPVLYQAAAGTENLFARDWGMSPDPARVVAAVRRWRVVRRDVGECGGRYFGLMLSVGPDASVIRRVRDLRTGPISHFTYLRPLLAELCDAYLPRLMVWVDGRPLVHGQRGVLVIAISRQYAFRMDPALFADAADGLFDVVFMPADSAADVAVWAWLRWARLHGWREGIEARGTVVRVETEGDTIAQMDGDAVDFGGMALTCGVVAGGIGVLDGR